MSIFDALKKRVEQPALRAIGSAVDAVVPGNQSQLHTQGPAAVFNQPTGVTQRQAVRSSNMVNRATGFQGVIPGSHLTGQAPLDPQAVRSIINGVPAEQQQLDRADDYMFAEPQFHGDQAIPMPRQPVVPAVRRAVDPRRHLPIYLEI